MLINIETVYVKPFRIGKKQKLAVLDGKGHEVVIFKKGDEKMARHYVEFLNSDIPVEKLSIDDVKEITTSAWICRLGNSPLTFSMFWEKVKNTYNLK